MSINKKQKPAANFPTLDRESVKGFPISQLVSTIWLWDEPSTENKVQFTDDRLLNRQFEHKVCVIRIL